MAGGALTNRPAATGDGEKNVAAMAFDVLEKGFFNQWALSDELSARLILGKTPEGAKIKSLKQKVLKVQNGGYDYRVRINQGVGGLLHGRINDSSSVTSATGNYFDYAIYKPRLYQGVFQLGMQEMAQLDGDGVEAMDRAFDLMDAVTTIGLETHWEDLEKDFCGYGFQNEGSVASPTNTSGVIGFPGFGHMLDNANKSGVTSPEHFYGYIDVSDSAFASWKAYVKNATGGLVSETDLYATIRGCSFGSNKPTAIYVGEVTNAYIYALGIDKIRFVNVSADRELAPSGMTVCGIPVIPIKTMDSTVFADTFAGGAKYYKTIDVSSATGTPVGDLDTKIQQGALVVNENTLRVRAWRMLADKNGGPKSMSPLDMEAKLGVIKKYAHLLTFGTTVRKFNGILQGIQGTAGQS